MIIYVENSKEYTKQQENKLLQIVSVSGKVSG